MTRTEDVLYGCEVCGKTAKAQKAGESWVRPHAWGQLFLSGQDGTMRISSKLDFCSEECAIKAFEDWREEAYGEDH
jgi:hypothetical protein